MVLRLLRWVFSLLVDYLSQVVGLLDHHHGAAGSHGGDRSGLGLHCLSHPFLPRHPLGPSSLHLQSAEIAGE